jgi:hypothetical protein
MSVTFVTLIHIIRGVVDQLLFEGTVLLLFGTVPLGAVLLGGAPIGPPLRGPPCPMPPPAPASQYPVQTRSASAWLA